MQGKDRGQQMRQLIEALHRENTLILAGNVPIWGQEIALKDGEDSMNRSEQLAAIAMGLARPHATEDDAEWLITAATPLIPGDVSRETKWQAIGRTVYALRGDGPHGGKEAIIDGEGR